MIAVSEFVRAGGHAAHLSREDTNRAVTTRWDLSRGVPHDLELAIAVAAGISRTNPRTRRDLIHFKVSPSQNDERAFELALELIEREYGISASAMRVVVVHAKGDRPAHMHVLYSVIDAETGKAIPSQNKFVQNELIARQLEMLLGEPIVPGPYHLDVVDALRKRGQHVEADSLATFAPAEKGQRVGTETRRQNDRVGLDTKAAARKIYGVWTEASGDLGAFALGLDAIGFDLVHGDKAVIARDRETGGIVPVRRGLNMASREAGAALDYTRYTFDERFGVLPSFDAVKDDKSAQKLKLAQAATDEELRRHGQEALVDGDARQAARAYGALAARRKRAAETQRRADLDLKLEIQRERHRLDLIRRKRVDRAFLAAAIFDTPRMRKVVFAAAATGVLLAGGGLALALIAAGFTIGALPTREQARAVKRQVLRDRRAVYDRDRRERAAAKQERSEAAPKPAVFRSRNDDLIAGLLLHLVVTKKRRRLRDDERRLWRACVDTLGPTAASVVRHLGRRRNATSIGQSLGLRGPSKDRDRIALASAFRGRMQSAIADMLDPTTAMCMAQAMASGAVAYGVEEHAVIERVELPAIPGAGGERAGLDRPIAPIPARRTFDRGPGRTVAIRPSKGRGIGD